MRKEDSGPSAAGMARVHDFGYTYLGFFLPTVPGQQHFNQGNPGS